MINAIIVLFHDLLILWKTSNLAQRPCVSSVNPSLALRSDEGLTLEKSALKLLTVANLIHRLS